MINEILLTGTAFGRTISFIAKDYGHGAMSVDALFLARTPKGSKTYAVNGDFYPVENDRRRGDTIFTTEDGREYRLAFQTVIRNRHGRLCGLVEQNAETTVLPYFQAA